MAVRHAQPEPEPAVDQERSRRRQFRQVLRALDENPVRLLGPGGATVELPEELRLPLREFVLATADGRPVVIISGELLLGTEQAADVLNVSLPYLVQLLEAGTIPSTPSGTNRTIRLADLTAYKQQRDRERAEILDRLSQLGQDLGLYDKT